MDNSHTLLSYSDLDAWFNQGGRGHSHKMGVPQQPMKGHDQNGNCQFQINSLDKRHIRRNNNEIDALVHREPPQSLFVLPSSSLCLACSSCCSFKRKVSSSAFKGEVQLLKCLISTCNSFVCFFKFGVQLVFSESGKSGLSVTVQPLSKEHSISSVNSSCNSRSFVFDANISSLTCLVAWCKLRPDFLPVVRAQHLACDYAVCDLLDTDGLLYWDWSIAVDPFMHRWACNIKRPCKCRLASQDGTCFRNW